MASPWTFLSRLTSRRQESKEPQGVLTNAAKSEEATSPVEATTDQTLNSSEGLVAGVSKLVDQLDVEITIREHSAEAGSSVQAKGDLGAKLLDAAGPALPDEGDFTATPNHGALKFTTFKKDQTRRKSAAIKQA